MLERQEIRLATVAVLSGRTAAGDRVYPTQILPWRRPLPLPAIGVYTLEERGEAVGAGLEGAWMMHYTLTLAIDVLVSTEVAAELEPAARLMVDSAAPLDALCEEVVQTLLRTPAWYKRATAVGGRLQRFEAVPRLDTTQTPGRVEDTDQRTMAAQIQATVTYTCEYPPYVDEVDLCRVCVDFDVIEPAADPNVKFPGPDGRIEVELEIPRPGIDPPLCDEPPLPPRRTPHPERELEEEDSSNGNQL